MVIDTSTISIVSSELNGWSKRLHIKLSDGRTARFKYVNSGSDWRNELVIMNHDEFYPEEVEVILNQYKGN